MVWAKMRARESKGPPAGKGTTMVMGLVGYASWALEPAGVATAAAKAATAAIRELAILGMGFSLSV